MKNNVIYTIVIVVLVAAGAFYGGMTYQKSQSSNFSGRQFGQGNQNAQGARRLNGGRPVVGEILSQDANSITVKLQDGGSKIILLSKSTTVSKTDTASISDLKTGVRIAAFGTDNADGSLTAQNIQLNPMIRGTASSR